MEHLKVYSTYPVSEEYKKSLNILTRQDLVCEYVTDENCNVKQIRIYRFLNLLSWAINYNARLCE